MYQVWKHKRCSVFYELGHSFEYTLSWKLVVDDLVFIDVCRDRMPERAIFEMYNAMGELMKDVRKRFNDEECKKKGVNALLKYIKRNLIKYDSRQMYF